MWGFAKNIPRTSKDLEKAITNPGSMNHAKNIDQITSNPKILFGHQNPKLKKIIALLG